MTDVTQISRFRGAVVLPHGTGKKVRILVFAKDAKAEEAKAAGADYVGAEDLIPRIQNENWFDYDVVVAYTGYDGCSRTSGTCTRDQKD